MGIVIDPYTFGDLSRFKNTSHGIRVIQPAIAANECYVPVVFARKDITDDFLPIDTDFHTITYVVPEYMHHVKKGIRGMSHAGL
jgi:hypothetical protein